MRGDVQTGQLRSLNVVIFLKGNPVFQIDSYLFLTAPADGGKVTLPLADTFWSEAYGMLVDRFGTPWMVSGGAAKSLR